MSKKNTTQESDPWVRFDDMTDDDIDYSDIPEADEEFFKNAKRVMPKRPVSLRIDTDIISHFKAGGKGWQTRINETLRKAISKPKRARKIKTSKTEVKT